MKFSFALVRKILLIPLAVFFAGKALSQTDATYRRTKPGLESNRPEQPMTSICNCTAQPTYLDFGIVPVGALITRGILLNNGGDTDLVIQSIDGISYPILAVHGIAPGTVIPKGQTDGILITVDVSLTNYVDTIVMLKIHFQQDCASPLVETLQIAAYFVNPVNTGDNFDTVLVNSNSIDSIVAMNMGNMPLALKEIDIINQAPVGSPQFSFDNGMQRLSNINVLLKSGMRKNFHVNFRPTPDMVGWDTATIQCTWDSVGKKTFYSRNILTGYGISGSSVNFVEPDLSTKVYPNPFFQSTTIKFISDKSAFTQVSIHNLLGSEVARLFTGSLDGGEHSFIWDAHGMPPGMYICTIRASGRTQELPVMLVK
jgi:hypothetical protein